MQSNSQNTVVRRTPSSLTMKSMIGNSFGFRKASNLVFQKSDVSLISQKNEAYLPASVPPAPPPASGEAKLPSPAAANGVIKPLPAKIDPALTGKIRMWLEIGAKKVDFSDGLAMNIEMKDLKSSALQDLSNLLYFEVRQCFRLAFAIVRKILQVPRHLWSPCTCKRLCIQEYRQIHLCNH